MPLGALNVSGLSSGIDWRSMIDEIMRLEHRRVDLISQQKTRYNSQLQEWQKINSQLLELGNAAADLKSAKGFQVFQAGLTSSSSVKPGDILSALAGANAAKGNYSVKVLATAKAQKLGSASFASKTESLNLSGDFLINGKAVSIKATDSLEDIRDRISESSTGSEASGVTATIVKSTTGQFQLHLTSNKKGAASFALLDASSTNVLRALGFVDGSVLLKSRTSDGAKSDGLSSTTAAVGALLGLSTPPGPAAVSIGGQQVVIDLSTQSLTDIANAINSLSGVSAEVVSETNDDGTVAYRIDVSGTTSFVDNKNVLQALGFLKGKHGAVQEVHASDVANTATTGGGGVPISDSTTFAQINTGGRANNVAVGDTITITGVNHDGVAISTTFTIANRQQRLNANGGFLRTIENAFGGPTKVDAYISNGADGNTAGTLVVKDLVAGDSQLAVAITTNNEGGGTLNFGTLTETVAGRSMELVAGADAKLQIDGVTYQRASNTIDDLIDGVTLDLKTADPATIINLNIDYDFEEIKEKIKKFVDDYNNVVNSINSNFKYDAEKQKTGGPLFGDGTLRSVQSDLINVILQKIPAAGKYSTLGLAGISIDESGLLNIDDNKLTAALQNDLDSVIRLFAAQGSSTISSLEYVAHGRHTVAGSYTVNITSAASRASSGPGSANLDDANGLDTDDILTITDIATGRVATIALTAGMKGDAIVAAINSELATQYSQIITSSQHNTVLSGAGGGALTASSTFAQINTGSDSNNIVNGDTIYFSGTTRNGTQVTGSYTIADKSSDTLQGLLNAIEEAYGSEATASIDASGAIVLTDRTTGTSQLSMNITANNEGGGSLTFGVQDITTAGRYAMEMHAGKDSGGHLVLTHELFGAEAGFSIAQTSNALGFTDASFIGTDVAGTINGQSATGHGQILTGNEGAVGVEGLVVKYTGSATGNIGNVSVQFGVMELMDRGLFTITDSFDGYVKFKQDSLQNSIKRSDHAIERMERRLELQKERLVRQFVSMENTIGRLRSQNTAFGLVQF